MMCPPQKLKAKENESIVVRTDIIHDGVVMTERGQIASLELETRKGKKINSPKYTNRKKGAKIVSLGVHNIKGPL